jgi:F-type H+-transporting ATPase subunit delta
MRSQVLAKRYAQGLLHSCRDDKEYNFLYTHLCEFAEFLGREKKLNDLFARPFLSTTKKMRIAEEILSTTSLPKKISRFILLLIQNDRWSILPQVIEIIPDLWNIERGVVTYEVSSVIPLTDRQKDLLTKKLEKIEKSPVALKYLHDPGLIGGIALRKGNIVYDASVEGHLTRLHEIIRQG